MDDEPITALDRAWAEINALGGYADPKDLEATAYCDALDAPILTGPITDWADAIDAKLDNLSGKAAVDLFNDVIKAAPEWAVLREADPGRAKGLKDKCGARAKV